ncbi:hypothetical protein DPMN_149633 [Dreissena polymorpha]|uniref:Uncharacterized protein n=1 Tax=Dreissena polymorpha TaxID=45954 RepID=A0A9D4FHR7_DREPO|nr:hypothetical protein DPMN_149633 [Dreissena polymorpha]
MYAECPSLLVFYADKSHDFTTVNWQVPLHSDNAGLALNSRKTSSRPITGYSGASERIQCCLQALDSENNTSTGEIQLAVKRKYWCHYHTVTMAQFKPQKM